MFENGSGPNGWGDEPPFHKPVFVLGHEAREPSVKTGTTFTFVDGIENALEQAQAAAGDKDVQVAGGANAVQQFIEEGLLDELQVHIAHVLLGGGIPLFGEKGSKQVELEATRVVEAPGVTHIQFRVAS
jgi:dihydrofolate reductase